MTIHGEERRAAIREQRRVWVDVAEKDHVGAAIARLLTEFADPDFRDKLPKISFGGGGRSAEGHEAAAARGAQPPERVAEMVALGDELIAGPKGYQALGAFNREERKQALDQLGFDRQLVFSTFAAGACFYGDSIELRYAAARAHNRAMEHFCAEDERLMGVATLPLDEPELAAAELDQIIERQLAAPCSIEAA